MGEKSTSETRPTNRRQRRTKAEIGRLEGAIYRLLEDDSPMTVRQVFYRLVSAGEVAKTENDYKNVVSRLLVKMRMAGDIPFDWIADNTRWMRKPRTYSSLEFALQNTAQTYRRSLWDNQEVYCEIWTEKDALAGVLLEETREWDVPLMVSKGFASVTYLYEAAKAIEQTGKPAYLYYFGDHDPSGIYIDRAIERRLREFAPDAEIHFERVAVRPEQIAEWNLPTRPTKKTKANAHSRNFEGDSVEVDAIPPRQLRQLTRQCIVRHVDEYALEVMRVAERSEREVLMNLSRKLGGCRSGDEEE
jgi:hypothetical protein